MRSVRACVKGAKKSRGGFTLAEVIFGAGILAMFMLGLPLAIRMARNAVPDGGNSVSATMDAARIMELMLADIAFATSVNSTAKYDQSHISITVPDRNGDGLQETVSYGCDNPPVNTVPKPPPGVQWLTRTYNGTSTVLLSNVEEFQLTYYTASVSTSTPGTNQQGNTLLTSITSGSTYGQSVVNSNTSYAQYFEPTLPANTVNWNLTKIRLQMLKNASGGAVNVQIRSAVGGLPSSSVLAQVTANSFPSQVNWQDINFNNNANGLSPYSGFCVVVISATGNAACDLQFCNSASGTGGYLSSTDGGNTWTQNKSNDFEIMVYGQPNVASSGSSSTSYYLNDVRCLLRTNTNKSSRIVTTVRTYNQPQVPHP